MMHCNTLKHDNDSTVRGDGGSRVGEVRVTVRDPLMLADGPGSVSANYAGDIVQLIGSLMRRVIVWCTENQLF